MSAIDEKELFAFAAIAKEQQAAAQSAIDGLADLSDRAAGAVRSEVQTQMQEIRSQTVAAFKGHKVALGEAVEAAEDATDAIRESIKGVGWKLALVAFLAALGLVAAVGLAAFGLVEIQRYQVRSLANEKADLVQEVAALQAAAADFAKRAGKAKLTTCGDKGRLCVEIDRQAGGFGDDGQYAIIKGY